MNALSLAFDIDDNSVAINDLPSLRLAVNSSEVHLWRVDLNSFSDKLLADVLSTDEISRADRFHFANDRKHFIVARALLRTLLAAYLGLAPRLLKLTYGEMGKPFLTAEEQSSERPISFNLAHSAGRALYAFTQGREVGVDLEFIRNITAGDDIANRFFSANESAAIQALPMEQRKEAFFNCWTRKEAYIKARGEGLSIPLDSFEVSVAPAERAGLFRNHVDEGEIERWEMHSVNFTPDYVGALVVEGHGWQLKTFKLVP